MSEVEKTGVTTELPHSLNQSPEPGGGRSRMRGVPYSGGPPKRRRTPLGRRHGIRRDAARALAGCRRTAGVLAGCGGPGAARAASHIDLRSPAPRCASPPDDRVGTLPTLRRLRGSARGGSRLAVALSVGGVEKTGASRTRGTPEAATDAARAVSQLTLAS